MHVLSSWEGHIKLTSIYGMHWHAKCAKLHALCYVCGVTYTGRIVCPDGLECHLTVIADGIEVDSLTQAVLW